MMLINKAKSYSQDILTQIHATHQDLMSGVVMFTNQLAQRMRSSTEEQLQRELYAIYMTLNAVCLSFFFLFLFFFS